MKQDDSLQFVRERLRHNHSPLHRELHLVPPERIRRRFAVELEKGAARRFDHVGRTVLVCCASGSVWITHDGDPKDIILGPRETYHVDREDAMHVFAMQDCMLEIEFEDDLLPH